MAQIFGLPPVAVALTAEHARAERTLTQSVAQAVVRLNAAQVAGEGREITFSVDSATRRPVVKVVDVDTREVVHQWPAEYLLRLDSNRTRDSR